MKVSNSTGKVGILSKDIFLYTYTLIFLLISSTVFSQTRIQGKQYPDLLWGEGEEDPAQFGEGGFILHEQDFIQTTGKLWQGSPPPSQGRFLWKEEEITNSGEFNNRAMNLILTGVKADRDLAKDMLTTGIKFDPRFFPFRYNLGRLYQLNQEYEEALLEFEFAKKEIPEYYRTYIHIGTLSQTIGEIYYAIESYKKAAELNTYDTEAVVLLAEYYMETGLSNRAKLYLDRALKIEEGSPNARLGLARLEFQSQNYYRAYKILQDTELFSPEGVEKRYNKKFHFYFAETASRVQDYETATTEYNKILEYPTDPFFSTFSIKVLQRRRDIAKKFSDIKKSGLENTGAVEKVEP
jgi:hypothetical protein